MIGVPVGTAYFTKEIHYGDLGFDPTNCDKILIRLNRLIIWNKGSLECHLRELCITEFILFLEPNVWDIIPCERKQLKTLEKLGNSIRPGYLINWTHNRLAIFIEMMLDLFQLDKLKVINFYVKKFADLFCSVVFSALCI